MRWLTLILVLLLVLLQYKLWLSEGGLIKVWELNKTITTQQAENNALRERNKALEAEVRDLKQGKEAIEERARSELGMIKKGETFYQIVQ